MDLIRWSTLAYTMSHDVVMLYGCGYSACAAHSRSTHGVCIPTLCGVMDAVVTGLMDHHTTRSWIMVMSWIMSCVSMYHGWCYHLHGYWVSLVSVGTIVSMLCTVVAMPYRACSGVCYPSTWPCHCSGMHLQGVASIL